MSPARRDVRLQAERANTQFSIVVDAVGESVLIEVAFSKSPRTTSLDLYRGSSSISDLFTSTHLVGMTFKVGLSFFSFSNSSLLMALTSVYLTQLFHSLILAWISSFFTASSSFSKFSSLPAPAFCGFFLTLRFLFSERLARKLYMERFCEPLEKWPSSRSGLLRRA